MYPIRNDSKLTIKAFQLEKIIVKNPRKQRNHEPKSGHECNFFEILRLWTPIFIFSVNLHSNFCKSSRYLRVVLFVLFFLQCLSMGFKKNLKHNKLKTRVLKAQRVLYYERQGEFFHLRTKKTFKTLMLFDVLSYSLFSPSCGFIWFYTFFIFPSAVFLVGHDPWFYRWPKFLSFQ